MIISQVLSSITETVRQITNGLANRLTAADNWGPEGKKFQVLTSRGPRPGDPPPTFMDIKDILTGISSDESPDIVGPPGPPGPPGSPGVPGPPGSPGTVAEILRGASWSNGGLAVNLTGQTKGVTPPLQTDGTITLARALGQGTGSASWGVKKCHESVYPGGLVDITGGVDPAISAASIANVSLAGWTLAVLEGDVFEFELKSVSVFTQVELVLEITPS